MIAYFFVFFNQSCSLIFIIKNKIQMITSFPNRKTVDPLNGWVIIDCELFVISTPHTRILLKVKYSLATFTEGNASNSICLSVPWLPKKPNSFLNFASLQIFVGFLTSASRDLLFFFGYHKYFGKIKCTCTSNSKLYSISFWL